MSYGDCQTQIRDALTWLLTHPRPATLGEPAIVERYRDTVLAWCREAVDLATSMPIAQPTVVKPLHDLRRRVDAATAPAPGPRLTTLLATRHAGAHLDAWQQAAEAAVQAERELFAVVAWPSPASRHWMVAKDAADVVRALVALDHRYAGLDGYTTLPLRAHLGVAAVAAAGIARDGPLDYRADADGWQPPPPPQPVTAAGLAAAIQEQHNAATHLHRQPSARALRQLLLSQAWLSRDAARAADTTASASAGRFHERTQLYRQLVAAARDIDGNIGEPGGNLAVAASAEAASRTATARRSEEVGRDQVDHLLRACRLVDDQVGTAIRRGFANRVYLVPAIKQLKQRGRGIAEPATTRWRPALPGEPIPPPPARRAEPPQPRVDTGRHCSARSPPTSRPVRRPNRTPRRTYPAPRTTALSNC